LTLGRRHAAQVLQLVAHGILALWRETVKLLQPLLHPLPLLRGELLQSPQPLLHLLAPLRGQFRKRLLPLLGRHFLEAFELGISVLLLPGVGRFLGLRLDFTWRRLSLTILPSHSRRGSAHDH